jgi:hypothetical protein
MSWRRTRNGEVTLLRGSFVHSALGKTDKVLQLLEEAFEERSASLVFHLTHPLVDCVRENPRFIALSHRMKLDHLVDYRPETPWKPLPSWREQ